MTSCYPDSMIRAFGEDTRSNAVNDRARVLMICLYMPALASERGCPIRTQPLPQLPAWPCKTNSNAPLQRRDELPCIVLFECKHHRVLWPIVDAASGDCSFLLGCCDSSLRLWLLRCNAVASCPNMNNTRAGLMAWRSTLQEPWWQASRLLQGERQAETNSADAIQTIYAVSAAMT